MTTLTATYLLAILFSSLIGSFHCAAMCGCFIQLFKTQCDHYLYHIGRLCSYLLIGYLCGYFGAWIWKQGSIWSRMLGAIMAFSLFYRAFDILTTQFKWNLSVHTKINNYLSRLSSPLSKKVLNWSIRGRGAWLIGFLSLLLPCSWLYSYALIATNANSPESGSLIMLFFWLGGLPAMLSLSYFLKLKLLPKKFQSILLAGVFIFSGVICLLNFVLIEIKQDYPLLDIFCITSH